MKAAHWFSASILTVAFLAEGGLQFARAEKHSLTKIPVFGVLRALPPEEAYRQAEAWLKTAGKIDADRQKAFQAMWHSDKPVLDKVVGTLVLGDPAAEKLLTEARNTLNAAPTELPAIFKDAKLPLFYRANLALAYARALSGRGIYEESLAALRLVQPEQVVDPAACLFHRAVAEHALMRKSDADKSIQRLLEDVAEPADRYRTLAALMAVDMAKWKDHDLGWVARKMQNSERRLELGRGGPRTQAIQKDALVQLDRMIEEVAQRQQREQQRQQEEEQQQNGQMQVPNGGVKGDKTSKKCKKCNKMDDCDIPSPGDDNVRGGHTYARGEVNVKKFKETAEVWGKLPEKERVKAMLGLTRELPPGYRQVIEKYFKELARKSDTDADK